MSRPKLIVVDSDENVARRVRHAISQDFEVHSSTSPARLVELSIQEKPALLLLGLSSCDAKELELLRRAREALGSLPIIVLSSRTDVRAVVDVMKAGASEFFPKSFDPRELKDAITKLVSGSPTSQIHQSARGRIVGLSPQIREVWRLIDRYAPTGVTILLQGESGTGKELFARAIHEASTPAGAPFVPLDCATLPESLLEAEMFGYERGAFTGATEQKPGKFELAEGGTLFMDEVCNLPPQAQPKLLRVLQDHEIYRLGSKSPKPVRLNLRLVAASNVDLRKAVEEGAFRQDLFFRLSVLTIFLPPLREREGDIAILAEHFLRHYAQAFHREVNGITPEALEILCRYPWQGNVRELENVLKGAVLTSGELVSTGDVPPLGESGWKQFADTPHWDGLEPRNNRLKETASHAQASAEKELLSRILSQGSFTKTALARTLGVDRKTLRTKMHQYGLA